MRSLRMSPSAVRRHPRRAASGYEGRDATRSGPRSSRHRYRGDALRFRAARGSTGGSGAVGGRTCSVLRGVLQQEITGPVLVHDSEPRKRALLSAIGEGLGGASRYASGLGSRTKDYLGSARSNFTRPVFKEPARPRSRKKKPRRPWRIDAREAAVIALSIVGLAEVGWIGWRVTNPPPASLVVNRGARSSQAATVEPIATPPAPAPRAKSTPPPVAHAKMAAPTPESASLRLRRPRHRHRPLRRTRRRRPSQQLPRGTGQGG